MAEWISLLDAVHQISGLVGGDKKAKDAIFERLRDGAIESRAWWHAIGVDVGRPYVEPSYTVQFEPGEEPKINELDIKSWYRENSAPTVSQNRIGDGIAVDVQRNINLGQAFWAGMSKSDRKRWDWSTGFCIGTYNEGWAMMRSDGLSVNVKPARQFALGVELKQDDVKAIVSSIMSVPVKASAQRSRAGRNRDPEWAYWVAELIFLHDSVELENMTTNKIVTILQDRLATQRINYPGPTSTNPIVKIVQELIRARRSE